MDLVTLRSAGPAIRTDRVGAARRGLRTLCAALLALALAACSNPLAPDDASQSSEHTTSSGNHTTSSGNLSPSGR